MTVATPPAAPGAAPKEEVSPTTPMPTTSRKRGPNKAKATKSGTVKVKVTGRYNIHCHPLSTTLRPGTVTEVADIPWIKNQIKHGVLKEM